MKNTINHSSRSGCVQLMTILFNDYNNNIKTTVSLQKAQQSKIDANHAFDIIQNGAKMGHSALLVKRCQWPNTCNCAKKNQNAETNFFLLSSDL